MNDSCVRVRVDDNMCLYLRNVCSSGRAQHNSSSSSFRSVLRVAASTQTVISDFERDSFDPDISESGEVSFPSAVICCFIDDR